jgi:hypothetical protein
MANTGGESGFVRKTHKKSSNVARLSNLTCPEVTQLLLESQQNLGLTCLNFNFDGVSSEGIITFNTDNEAKKF